MRNPVERNALELGAALSRARRARGITLEDAERDTHVSRRYLQALEAEDFAVFPAPVYARGFLRTYARYLGLNAEELLRIFPAADLTVDITPLPQVSRPPTQAISVNWIVAAAVMLFLLGAGVLLLRGGEEPLPTTATNRGASPAATTPASQPVIAPPAAAPTSAQPVQGKQIGPIRPGVLPDFVGADLPSALAVLRDNQMSYVIVEAPNRGPKGIIYSQSPNAGARITADASVTLYVSAGSE